MSRITTDSEARRLLLGISSLLIEPRNELELKIETHIGEYYYLEYDDERQRLLRSGDHFIVEFSTNTNSTPYIFVFEESEGGKFRRFIEISPHLDPSLHPKNSPVSIVSSETKMLGNMKITEIPANYFFPVNPANQSEIVLLIISKRALNQIELNTLTSSLAEATEGIDYSQCPAPSSAKKIRKTLNLQDSSTPRPLRIVEKIPWLDELTSRLVFEDIPTTELQLIVAPINQTA